MKPFTIGNAAKAAGVSVETIRFYERKGLIAQPARPANGGVRDYGRAVVSRLRFIAQAKDLGFSLAEVAELLALRATPGSGCGQVRARAAAKRQNVRAKIVRLTQIQTALDDLIARCPGQGHLSECSIIDAMEQRDGKNRDLT